MLIMFQMSHPIGSIYHQPIQNLEPLLMRTLLCSNHLQAVRSSTQLRTVQEHGRCKALIIHDLAGWEPISTILLDILVIPSDAYVSANHLPNSWQCEWSAGMCMCNRDSNLCLIYIPC